MIASLQRCFPRSDVDVLSCLDTSRYPQGREELDRYDLRAMSIVADHYGQAKLTEPGPEDAGDDQEDEVEFEADLIAAVIDGDRVKGEFIHFKRVMQGLNPDMQLDVAGRTVIRDFHETFPDFAKLAEIALVIPVSSVPASGAWLQLGQPHQDITEIQADRRPRSAPDAHGFLQRHTGIV